MPAKHVHSLAGWLSGVFAVRRPNYTVFRTGNGRLIFVGEENDDEVQTLVAHLTTQDGRILDTLHLDTTDLLIEHTEVLSLQDKVLIVVRNSADEFLVFRLQVDGKSLSLSGTVSRFPVEVTGIRSGVTRFGLCHFKGQIWLCLVTSVLESKDRSSVGVRKVPVNLDRCPLKLHWLVLEENGWKEVLTHRLNPSTGPVSIFRMVACGDVLVTVFGDKLIRARHNNISVRDFPAKGPTGSVAASASGLCKSPVLISTIQRGNMLALWRTDVINRRIRKVGFVDLHHGTTAEDIQAIRLYGEKWLIAYQLVARVEYRDAGFEGVKEPIYRCEGIQFKTVKISSR
jgi:hypothetical protein